MTWSRLLLMLAVVSWLALGPGAPAASAQLANPVINEFEMAPAGSLEWEIMDRLAARQRYDPRDLPRLARLTVLETIAMYENVRADLPATAFGARIEGEMSLLWDAADLFWVSTAPGNTASLIRSRPLLSDVEAAYRRVNDSLGALPGLSERAAYHLQDVARLLPVMSALMDAMDTDYGVPQVAPAVPEVDVAAAIRQSARGVIEQLAALTKSLQGLRPLPRELDRLTADLDGLSEGLDGLDRALGGGDAAGGLVDSLRIMRARLWLAEARLVRDVHDPAVLERWRRIRQQTNAISDRFGRSRVISLEPSARPAAAADRRLLAQVDRTVASFEEKTAADREGTTANSSGPQFRTELAELNHKLLQFRRQAASAEPAGTLDQTLREAEDLSRRIAERVRTESRIFRGGAPRRDFRGLEAALKEVEGLRAALTKFGGNPPPPPAPLNPGPSR